VCTGRGNPLRMERRRRWRSARTSYEADKWSVSTYPTLLLTGVICGIDIRDPPWPHAIQLDDGFLAGPREVRGVGRQDGDTPHICRRDMPV
jgi:hypothetical protein